MPDPMNPFDSFFDQFVGGFGQKRDRQGRPVCSGCGQPAADLRPFPPNTATAPVCGACALNRAVTLVQTRQE